MAKKHIEYWIDGVKVPGATTVLRIVKYPQWDSFLRSVGFEKADSIMSKAGEFGSTVHACVEASCLGQKLDMDEELTQVIDNFKGWSDNHVARWVAFEKAVYSSEHLFAGTTDAVAELKNGQLALVDFKTSSAIRDDYYMQMAAYRACDRVEDDAFDVRKIQKSIILHLDKKRKLWEHVYADQAGAFDDFLAARRLFRRVNGW